MSHARALYKLTAALARLPLERVEQLGSAMLAEAAGEAGAPRRSASASLNPEGIPLELAVTASAERLRFRLVVDPAASESSPARRCRIGRGALHAAARLNGSQALGELLESQLDAMLPDDDARLAAYRSGPFCMAAALGEPGVAIYIDAATHEAEAFERAREWLARTLPDPSAALAALEGMRPVASLAAVGMEGVSPRSALAKLYWRLRAPVTLASLAVREFAHADFACFAALAMAQRAVPPSGLMLAAGFRIDDGTLHDAKINLCGHCLAYESACWPGVVDGCTRAFGLAAIPASEALSRQHVDVSFITFGRTHRGERRVNCYFRPTSRH